MSFETANPRFLATHLTFISTTLFPNYQNIKRDYLSNLHMFQYHNQNCHRKHSKYKGDAETSKEGGAPVAQQHNGGRSDVADQQVRVIHGVIVAHVHC